MYHKQYCQHKLRQYEHYLKHLHKRFLREKVREMQKPPRQWCDGS